MGSFRMENPRSWLTFDTGFSGTKFYLEVDSVLYMKVCERDLKTYGIFQFELRLFQ